MFRVLTEEEARKATRWQAPDLTGQAIPVAQTRQSVSPIKLGTASSTNPLAVATAPGTHTSAPLLQAAQPSSSSVHRSPENTDSALNSHHQGSGTATTNLAFQNPSADMLQTSYDDGYARGYAEGNAALHQQSVKQLNDIIARLGVPALQVDDQLLEQEVLALSLDLTRVLLQREVQTQPDGMAQLVRAGIRQLPSATQGQTRVKLHPLDANMVREVITDMPEVLIVDDPSLGRGDCCIESGASKVNSGLDDWLGILAAELGILPDRDAQLS